MKTPEDIKKVFEDVTDALTELADSLNKLTENTPVFLNIVSFSDHTKKELDDALQYYQERECFKTCEAVKICISKLN